MTLHNVLELLIAVVAILAPLVTGAIFAIGPWFSRHSRPGNLLVLSLAPIEDGIQNSTHLVGVAGSVFMVFRDLDTMRSAEDSRLAWAAESNTKR